MNSTIFDYKKQENQGEIDTNQKKEKRKSLINGNTIIPLKLSVDDVSSLVKQYFSVLSENELGNYIEKFKKEMIDGKTLVKACADKNFMDKLLKRLDITLGHEVYYDNMIKLIKRRENELNAEKTNQDFEEADQGSSKSVTTVDPTKDEKTKPSCSMNTIIPHKLNNKEVCGLYEMFLQDLTNEDRDACTAKLKKEKITGRTLVLACENYLVMEELIKKLDFPLDYKLRFDDMIKHVRLRETELKKGTKDNNENEQSAEMSASHSIHAPKVKVQTISNSGCVIGEMYNHGDKQNINTACKYYAKKIEEL